ncbi:MAG TPA: molybdopterin molybdenumtransferase MoeA, partial [Burkholderiaceae bacterium]|nr:molybdopterin molybdenumtransferase MoeA [Burkholderiaceae bacterium]
MSADTASPAPARKPLLSLDEALARLLSTVQPLGETETLCTFDALGRVLAAEVRSQLDVPPHDNSAMDGYALRLADLPADGTVL